MSDATKMNLDGVLAGENILDDDYPVFPGYVYVCDARVVESPIAGNVLELKSALNVSEVRNCKMVDRNMF